MLINNWKKDIFTIPNILSLIRLLLIPVYMVIYLKAGNALDYILSAAILSVSCITDLLDGKIARHFNMVSNLGKILDPVADKATQFTLIVCLAIKHPILWYLLVFFTIKESYQIIAGSISLKKGKMLDGALFSGKISTTVLFLSLIIMILLPQLDETVVTIISIVDSVFLLIAFIDYIVAYHSGNEKFINLDSDKATDA